MSKLVPPLPHCPDALASSCRWGLPATAAVDLTINMSPTPMPSRLLQVPSKLFLNFQIAGLNIAETESELLGHLDVPIAWPALTPPETEPLTIAPIPAPELETPKPQYAAALPS